MVTIFCFAITKIITFTSGYDFGRTEIILCKFRSYIYVLALVLVRQFLCLISIDRWIVSTKNVRIRRLSSPHVVRWLIFGSILFWILFSIHALIGYQALLIRGCALFYSIQLTVS